MNLWISWGLKACMTENSSAKHGRWHDGKYSGIVYYMQSINCKWKNGRQYSGIKFLFSPFFISSGL